VLRFASLGSGSAGNALLVEASDGLFATRLLVDNGFGPRALAERLARRGLALDDLDAMVLTHEHSDHVAGVAALLRRCALPVLCSAGTARAAGLLDWPHLRRLTGRAVITVGGIELHPFDVPHDAAEPLQYVFSDGARRLGLLTDIGAPTTDVAAALVGMHALMLECNHDAALLAGGDYPPFLKARVGGDRGHLSNAQAAALLAGIRHAGLSTVVAAHLSQRNNRPSLAQRALAEVLGCADDEVRVADQASGLDWITV
jgi:phosphoribosyl 1,2-cyclic phosphodiesterase